MMRKIGLMGGTFNPVHIGHLILAEQARTEWRLDSVWFLPNGIPPHKGLANNTSKDSRVAMLSLAIASNPDFELCTIELDDVKKSYSYETVRDLKAMYPGDDFYFIMGEDSLISIEQWMAYELFLSEIKVLAMKRHGGEASFLMEKVTELNSRGYEVHALDAPAFEISSSEIRKRIVSGKSIRYMVPDQVWSYIQETGLYGGE